MDEQKLIEGKHVNRLRSPGLLRRAPYCLRLLLKVLPNTLRHGASEGSQRVEGRTPDHTTVEQRCVAVLEKAGQLLRRLIADALRVASHPELDMWRVAHVSSRK